MGVVITHKQMEFWKRNITAVVGMLIFSMGINLFIVPADLYNGGVLGVSQIIRTFLVRYLHLFFGKYGYCRCYQYASQCAAFYFGIFLNK